MAGRELKALIAAYRDRDDLSFRRAASAIIEQEEAKRHTALARELRRLLAAGTDISNAAEVSPPAIPCDRESDLPLVELLHPRRSLASLVLAEKLRNALDEMINEVTHWNQLDRAGVPRRRSVLLSGPPGCGKTSIGEAIATELGRQFAIVRTEAVVSSFLGETSTNLSKIFDFAESGPFVILFDEFDGIGKSRDDSTDHGELRRVVNAVLHLIDRYDGPSLVIATTNHSEILDSALWRRFSEVFEVGFPDKAQSLALLRAVLAGRAGPTVDLTVAVDALVNLPHAAVERTAHDAIRLAILDGRSTVTDTDLERGLERTLQRRWL